MSSDDIVDRLWCEQPPRGCMCQNCEAADEIERLRAAVDSLLHDMDNEHQPEWASEEAEAAGKKPLWCRKCGAADGSWPCSDRLTLDELKAARHQ